jgi:hypothetical protein
MKQPQSEPIVYLYEAYAPNPKKSDDYFQCGGEVRRSQLIDSGQDFDFFLRGISDHIYQETGVRCLPSTIRLHKLELVKDDLFPSHA